MEQLLTAKGITTSGGSLGLITIFSITHELQIAISILGVLIMIDFLTGVIKSWILKKTTSEGMARGLMRKCILILVPIILMIAAKGIDINISTLVTWIMSALIFTEAYSSIGNIYTIQTGKKAKEYDVMTILMKKLGKIIDAFLVDKKD